MFLDVNENSQKKILQWIKSLCVAPQESTSNEHAYGVFQKRWEIFKSKIMLAAFNSNT